MRGPGVLSTALAVAKKEALKRTRDLKFDVTTQTGAGCGFGHDEILMFVLIRLTRSGSCSLPD